MTAQRAETAPAHRVAGALAAALLSAALLAGCSSEGAQTDCNLDACSVTFDRGVDAKASVLGVEAKLISSQGDQITVEVAGEQISLTVGQAATEIAGLRVSLESVNDTQAVVQIARA